MNKYLYSLNWTLVVFALLLWLVLKSFFCLSTYISCVVGCILGCMQTAGFITWEFHRCIDPSKNKSWLDSYFKKDYRTEITAQVAILLVCICISALSWPSPFFWVVCSAIAGMSYVWTCNIVYEYLWYFAFIKDKLK